MYTKFCPSTSGKKHSVRPHWVYPLYYVYPKPQQQMPASCRRGTLIILPYVIASSMGTWPNPTQKVLQWMKGIFVCRSPQKRSKGCLLLGMPSVSLKPKQHRDAAVAGMGSKIPSYSIIPKQQGWAAALTLKPQTPGHWQDEMSMHVQVRPLKGCSASNIQKPQMEITLQG